VGTVKLWSDEEVSRDVRVKAVFDDIRATRQSDFVNNVWRGLANQPAVLERTWGQVKAIMMTPGALDPLTRDSPAHGCGYCVHSHTAAATARGMTAAQHGELLAIIGLASQTNALVTALQLPIDPEFLAPRGPDTAANDSD
jgi:AhpD family alkylhydroperoxidase